MLKDVPPEIVAKANNPPTIAVDDSVFVTVKAFHAVDDGELTVVEAAAD